MLPHLKGFNLQKWIDDNRGDWGQRRVIWQDSDFIAFVTRGPNKRKDYHINPGDEIFYQLEGELNLHYLKDDKHDVAVLKRRRFFLLPASIRRIRRAERMAHGPSSSKRRRSPQEIDRFIWPCENAAPIFTTHRCALRRSGRCGQ